MPSHPAHGCLTLDSLAHAVERGEIDTVVAAFPDCYGRLVGKRFTARYFLEHVAAEGTHACDYLLACDIEMDPVPGYAFANWERGYGDFLLRPDLSTLRPAPWLPLTALVLCDVCRDGSVPGDDGLVEVAPRTILRRQLARAAERDLSFQAGSEIEFYLFAETYQSAREKGYRNLHPSGGYVEDYQLFPGTKEEPVLGAVRRGLEAAGIPVECSKGEWGPGQQEVNLQHCEVREQADRNVVYKQAVREIAHACGRAVTFMAKWDENLAGSGMHAHLSLWDAAGRDPIAQGGEPLGDDRVAARFRWALGGMLARARELTAFFAPNVSSYKRFQAGTFAPVNIAWCRDNRTAGFRLVGHGRSLRVECRIPGADANPYLVYAALVAAALDGIDHETAPPEPVTGDSYGRADLPRVPSNLREAITLLEGSEFARGAFGDEVVDHYLHFLRTEQRKFDAVVTDWERARFFERI